MSVFNVAVISANANGVLQVTNVAVFEREGFEELIALIDELGITPGVSYIPTENLIKSPTCLNPGPVWIGYIQLSDGTWFDPNWVVEEPPEPEVPEED